MRKRFPSLMRNTVAVLALVGYLTAALGVPLPVPASDPSPEITAEATVEVQPCGCVVTECASACCCSGSAPTNKPVEVTGYENAAFHWVIGEQIRKCHGMETLWLSIGIALPMPPSVQLAHEDPFAFALNRPFHPFHSLNSRPLAPPPRS